MGIILPKVYPITDTDVSGLSHAEQVERLVAGGATLIQIREKRKQAREFFSDAAECIRIARASGVKIIINDRVDIALALGADGVHLGQTDMPVDGARRILGDDKLIGFSTHNLEQVRAALPLPIDYLAFGPVYGTTTKVNPDPIAGLDQLRQACALADSLPVVAIGGINRENAPEVISVGAQAVALISAILANPLHISRNLQDLTASLG